MKPRPLRPSRRQRPIVEQSSKRQKPTVLLILEKWNPTVWNMPIPSNNCMQKICNNGNRCHGRGEERLPLLSNHLWNGTSGLPLEAHGVLIGPFQLLMGNMSLATLLHILPQVPSTREKSTLVVSHATTQAAPRPSLETK